MTQIRIHSFLILAVFVVGVVSELSDKSRRQILQQATDDVLSATFATSLPEASCTDVFDIDSVTQFLNQWNNLLQCQACSRVANIQCEDTPVFTVDVQPAPNDVTTDFFQSVVNTAGVQPSCILDQNVSIYIDAQVTVQSVSSQLTIPSSADTELALIQGCVVPPPSPSPPGDGGGLDLTFDFSFTAQNSPPPPSLILTTPAIIPAEENSEDVLPPVLELQQNAEFSAPLEEDGDLLSDFEPPEQEDISESQQQNVMLLLQDMNLLASPQPRQNLLPIFSPETEQDDEDLEDVQIIDTQIFSEEELEETRVRVPTQEIRSIEDQDLIGLDGESEEDVPQIETDSQFMEIILTDALVAPPLSPVSEMPNDFDNLEDVQDDIFVTTLPQPEPTIQFLNLQTQIVPKTEQDLIESAFEDSLDSLEEKEDDIQNVQYLSAPQMETDFVHNVYVDSEPMIEFQIDSDLDEIRFEEIVPQIEQDSKVSANSEEGEPETEQIVFDDDDDDDLNEGEQDVAVAPVQEDMAAFFPMLQEDLVDMGELLDDIFPASESIAETGANLLPVVESLLEDVEDESSPTEEQLVSAVREEIFTGEQIFNEFSADNLRELFGQFLGFQNY
eukprot:TRINITY_DN22907_c0_g1_i1.p1 TRINITY_DN22907_c0_g1~~TRINITY_DN22907_c0_g1_i1.p1  ORF type:complete len:614 (-),score=133.31 TRINITY_DN22907_c0_g1_i1:194-2035(-)